MPVNDTTGKFNNNHLAMVSIDNPSIDALLYMTALQRHFEMHVSIEYVHSQYEIVWKDFSV
jgi:hypothetical protein